MMFENHEIIDILTLILLHVLPPAERNQLQILANIF